MVLSSASMTSYNEILKCLDQPFAQYRVIGTSMIKNLV